MSSSGLVPRIHGDAISPRVLKAEPMRTYSFRTYWVYILASQPRGTLYIGVTNDILGRVELHRQGRGSAFTSRYGVAKLVHFEEFAEVKVAIQREKSLKRYMREWKINLIERSNPQWIDLYPGLVARQGIASAGAS